MSHLDFAKTCKRTNMDAKEVGPLLQLEKKRKKGGDITIAVYTGGSTSTIRNFGPIMDDRVLNHPDFSSITVEYVTNTTIRENKCNRFTTPMDFVKWLLAASVYFIVSQGMWLGLLTSDGKNRMSDAWTVDSIEKAAQMLAVMGRNGYLFFNPLHSLFV